MKSNSSDTQTLLNALAFAAEKHKNQRRKGIEQTPYINHCIQVARMISDIGRCDDAEVLMAALLHDTLEDTDTSPEELEKLFGSKVLGMVQEVSDDKTLPKAERKQLQIQHAPHLSEGAKLIKLADKISNIRDVMMHPPLHWDGERRLEYLEWAARVVNGLRGINLRLEKVFDLLLLQGRKSIKSENEAI